MYRALRGEYPHEDSIVVSSPLRRALSTVAIGLRYRFASAPTEKIQLVGSLQEISRNPDTLAITPQRSMPVLSWVEQDYQPNGGSSSGPDLGTMYREHVDLTWQGGAKPVCGNGLQRISGEYFIISNDFTLRFGRINIF